MEQILLTLAILFAVAIVLLVLSPILVPLFILAVAIHGKLNEKETQ